jgi:hypothetical protein
LITHAPSIAGAVIVLQLGSALLTPCCPLLLLLLLLLLLQVYTPVPCPFDDMCSFHSREYLEGLKSVDAPKVKQLMRILALLLLFLT